MREREESREGWWDYTHFSNNANCLTTTTRHIIVQLPSSVHTILPPTALALAVAGSRYSWKGGECCCRRHRWTEVVVVVVVVVVCFDFLLIKYCRLSPPFPLVHSWRKSETTTRFYFFFFFFFFFFLLLLNTVAVPTATATATAANRTHKSSSRHERHRVRRCLGNGRKEKPFRWDQYNTMHNIHSTLYLLLLLLLLLFLLLLQNCTVQQ